MRKSAIGDFAYSILPKFWYARKLSADKREQNHKSLAHETIRVITANIKTGAEASATSTSGVGKNISTFFRKPVMRMQVAYTP
jgi:hypothetical protein